MALYGRSTKPFHDENAEEVAKLLKKAVIQPGFDQRPAGEVCLKSKTRIKKERKVERGKTAGDGWYGLPAAELTDERRRDLELLQMRDTLDPSVHYRRPDRKDGALPKYFQVGKIVGTKADFYSSRMTRREQKPTMVEELMADHESVMKNKRRYDEIMKRRAITKRGTYQRGGHLNKWSKRKSQPAKRRK